MKTFFGPLHIAGHGDGILLLSPCDLRGACGHDLLLHVLAQGLPQQLLREVRVGSHAHDAGHKVRATHGDQKGNPRAHAVANQDLLCKQDTIRLCELWNYACMYIFMYIECMYAMYTSCCYGAGW